MKRLSPQDLDRMHTDALDALGIRGSGSLAPLSALVPATISNVGASGRRWRSHSKHHGNPADLDVIEGNRWE